MYMCKTDFEKINIRAFIFIAMSHDHCSGKFLTLINTTFIYLCFYIGIKLIFYNNMNFLNLVSSNKIHKMKLHLFCPWMYKKKQNVASSQLDLLIQFSEEYLADNNLYTMIYYFILYVFGFEND